VDTIVSYLPKLDSFLKKKYPKFTWVRGRVLEQLDKNDQNVYYNISYRLLSPFGRWEAIVIWKSGKEPELKKVRRIYDAERNH